jgi:putative addiction module antidote
MLVEGPQGECMVKTITVRQTGTSVSATIPREMADRFHIGVGDQLFAIELSDGVLLTPYDPTVDAGMKAYARIAKQHRAALRELAK